jgi:hypothetical protein
MLYEKLISERGLFAAEVPEKYFADYSNLLHLYQLKTL